MACREAPGRPCPGCPLGNSPPGSVSPVRGAACLKLPPNGLLGSSSRLVSKGLTIGGENRLSHRQFGSEVPPSANLNAYAGSACLARLPVLCWLELPAAWGDSRRGPPLGPAFLRYETQLQALFEGCRDALEHRQGMTLIVGVFESRDHGLLRSDEGCKLALR